MVGKTKINWLSVNHFLKYFSISFFDEPSMLLTEICTKLVACLFIFIAIASYTLIQLRISGEEAVLIIQIRNDGCGMGNQMFMYASGWGIALSNPHVTACVYGLENVSHSTHPDSALRLHVDILVPVGVKPLEECTSNTSSGFSYFMWRTFGRDHFTSFFTAIKTFEPPHTVYEPFRLKGEWGPEVVIITGYMESFKYFQNHAQPFFRMKKFDAAKQWLQHRNLTSVVHVRRSDKMNGPIATLHYFEQALSLLGNDGRVAVCTDDVPWVMQQTLFQNASVSINNSPGFDMALLTAATDTVIIGVGTFGWWGAYLSKARRKIFYPFQYIPTETPSQYRENDFIPYNMSGQGDWITFRQ